MKKQRQEDLPFFVHGRDSQCHPEIAHTIVEMVDSVAAEFRDSDWYWADFSANIERRRKKDYRAVVVPSRLNEAWRLLSKKKWLSLQNTNATKRITDISPLEGLTGVEQLVLAGNGIKKIEELSSLKRLKSLNLGFNRIADITPLADCAQLETLDLSGNPIKDLRILEQLPCLRELTISTNQTQAFSRCNLLANLRKLRIVGETRSSTLENFPEMPTLKCLDMAGVVSVAGIERYPAIVNLDLGSEEGFSLLPIAQLSQLTCITVRAFTGILDAEPLGKCGELRQIVLRTDHITGLRALQQLEHLHAVPLNKERSSFNIRAAKSLHEKLTPWDAEFLAAKPKAKPSSKTFVITKAKFDKYEKQPYGIEPEFADDGMLWNEREWLVGRIEADLEKRLELEHDFVIPVRNYGARSHALCLYSLKACKLIPWIIKTVQKHLCSVRNDWIFYFQSLLDEGPDAEKLVERTKDFEIWIYPDHIEAESKSCKVIRAYLHH